MILVGVDTGGTFTDFVVFKDGRWQTFKIPSTPSDPSQAVLEGLKKISGEDLLVLHGSTVATNALLERKGAKTAFITNEGFEDIIEIGRQARDKLYDLHYRKPKPLVDRIARLGLKCRLDHRGEVIEDLREEDLKGLAESLKNLGVEAVAVCFLHSYANPIHEKKVGEFIRKNLSVHVSLSHEILPEFREYERASTTVINAYVSPRMETYLSKLEKGIKGKLYVMQSSGGLIDTNLVKKQAVRTVLSGPAGGVVASYQLGKNLGISKLITFDMGGTSTDVSLIDGEPSLTTEFQIDRLPLKVPVIDIHTVGAGGGSIAWIDSGGILRVGPQSAGSEPGPVCYNRGGKDVTVTDANVFLGRLPAKYFLGGKAQIYPDLIEEPLRKLAEKLSSSLEDVAEAVVDVANSNMERAIRKISVQRGYDPSEFTLVSFGGSGSLHAVELARSIGIGKILIPPFPGLFSAVGITMAQFVRDYSLTIMLKAHETNYDHLLSLFEDLEKKALQDLTEAGFEKEKVLLRRQLDLRYEGQSYELTIDFSEDFSKAFEEKHKKLYHYTHDRPVEIVNLRLRAVALRETPPFPSVETEGGKPYLGDTHVSYRGQKLKVPLFKRERLKEGFKIEGPAVVVEYSSTLFLTPHAEAEVLEGGSILVNLKARDRT